MNQYKKENVVANAFPLISFQTKDVAWTFIMFLAVVLFPAIFAHTPHNQWITGTIVNALIFLAVWRLGIVNAALVAAIPSLIALARGLLPLPMAVFVPYIIISNLMLIAVFYFLRKYPLLGIVSASIAKFMFLFLISAYLVKLASPLLVMMQWPQFFTALAGGMIAAGTIKYFQKDRL